MKSGTGRGQGGGRWGVGGGDTCVKCQEGELKQDQQNSIYTTWKHNSTIRFCKTKYIQLDNVRASIKQRLDFCCSSNRICLYVSNPLFGHNTPIKRLKDKG